MVTNLENYRIRKDLTKKGMVRIPVFNRVFIEDNKLIGEQRGSKKLMIIKDYGKEN